jgi:C4-dicarboxylate-binding protein DctP
MSRVFQVCASITLALIASAGAAFSEPLKLRVTLQGPATDPFLGTAIVQFKNEVERETASALTFEIFDKGQLYIDDTSLEAVKSGAIEVALVGLNQITKVMPALSIMEQPFVFNFDALVRAATSPDGEIRQLIDDAILRTLGVRALWWETAGPQVLFTKEGDARVPRRIQNLKTRVYSETAANFARNCGAVPFILSTSKIHEGLSDGSLDMAMTSVLPVQTRNLWQVTKAITRTNHAASEFLVLVNEKVWQSLSEEQRSIAVKAARKVEGETRDRAAQLEAGAYDFARSKGMTIYDLSAKDIAEWRACSADVFTDYMEGSGELTRELMKAYAKLRTQPCCSDGPAADAFKGQ